MEEKTISAKKYILDYGLIHGIIWVIYDIIGYITNNVITGNWILSIVELSIHTSIIIYGIYAFKSANKGFLNLKEALKIGVSIALIGASIHVLWDILLLKVISPEIMDQLINQDQTINDNLIDQNGIIDKKNELILMRTLVSLIGNLILGFLISLFTGAIMQKKRDVFD